jgi:hypothetical protein
MKKKNGRNAEHFRFRFNFSKFNSIQFLLCRVRKDIDVFLFNLVFFLLLKWVIKLGWGTSKEHTPSNSIRGDLGSNEKIN